MAILSGKGSLLKKEDGTVLLPKTSSSLVYGSDGKSVQDKIGTTDISSIGTSVTDAIKKVKNAIPTVTLYSTTGSNTNGAMTQKAVTDALADVDNSVVLHKADYEALSETEKNNGTTYFVDDDNTGGGGGSSIITATDVQYNSSNVQEALDTVNQNLQQFTNTLGSADISTIGDGTVTGAISTVNNSLANNGKFELLAFVAGSSTNVTLTKPITEFKHIVLRVRGTSSGTGWSSLNTIPVGIFRDSSSTVIFRYAGSEQYDIAYINDTTLRATASNSTRSIQIYGES